MDSKGEQIIVEGKGIGFQKMPMELKDLSLIHRTYYHTKEQDISLIRSVPDKILEISGRVQQYAEQYIGDKLNPNLIFILADHIQFSLERYEKKIDIKMSIYYDIQLLYPKETKIAEYAMNLIRGELGVCLPDSETTGIALNIINSELTSDRSNENREETVEIITKYIEKFFLIKIKRDSFSYSRFVSHMEYLLRRANKEINASRDNLGLYRSIKEEIPEVEQCVNGIALLLGKEGFFLNEEEKLYLMLHVNRLCDREGL